jgi:plasmid stability protein
MELHMAQLLVRNLEDEILVKLKTRAKENNRSTEAEVRSIIASALQTSPKKKRSLMSYVGSVPATIKDPVAYVNALRDEWDR